MRLAKNVLFLASVALLFTSSAWSETPLSGVLAVAREADGIVLARVSSIPTRSIPEELPRTRDSSPAILQLTVVETWKGSPVWEVQSSTVPEAGKLLLLFLKHPDRDLQENEPATESPEETGERETGRDAAPSELPEVLWTLPVSTEDVGSLYAMIDQALKGLDGEATERAFYLRLAERATTRQAGIDGLRMLGETLSADERQRLAAAFVNTPSTDETLARLLELVGDTPSKELDELAVAALDRILAKPAVRGVSDCSLRHVLLRLEAFSPFWLVCGGNLEADVLLANWKLAKERLGLVDARRDGAADSVRSP